MKRIDKNECQLSLDFTKSIDLQVVTDKKQMALQEAERLEQIDRGFRRLCLLASIALIFAQVVL